MTRCRSRWRTGPQCSFKFYRLKNAGLIERRSPNSVRCLVLATAEVQLRAETEIEIVHGFKVVDELFDIDLRTRPFQGLDQDAR